MARYYVEDDLPAFSVTEETEFYRLRIGRSQIDEDDVEDFLDTTVEWLSSNPSKGILIDFTGVRSVCPGFTVELQRNYEDIKAKGLYVRFVNVDPGIQPYIDVQNITVVMSVYPEKPVLSAKAILADLASNLTDEQLMRKHSLSEKGLQSMFRKLLRKGLIARHVLARRTGIETTTPPTRRGASKSQKASVNASDVVKDIEQDMPDTMLMHKYKLSPKGLSSMLAKLRSHGLVSTQTIFRRKKLRLTLDSASDKPAKPARRSSGRKPE